MMLIDPFKFLPPVVISYKGLTKTFAASSTFSETVDIGAYESHKRVVATVSFIGLSSNILLLSASIGGNACEIHVQNNYTWTSGGDIFCIGAAIVSAKAPTSSSAILNLTFDKNAGVTVAVYSAVNIRRSTASDTASDGNLWPVADDADLNIDIKNSGVTFATGAFYQYQTNGVVLSGLNTDGADQVTMTGSIYAAASGIFGSLLPTGSEANHLVSFLHQGETAQLRGACAAVSFR